MPYASSRPGRRAAVLPLLMAAALACAQAPRPADAIADGTFAYVLSAHGSAQSPPMLSARAISTVMDHRVTYIADSIPFDACSVREALGGAEDFASRIVPHVRGLLDDASAPCPRSSRQGRSAVLVDSVRSIDSGVRVHVTVLRGELIHREDYDLVPGSSPVYMGVRQVRLWGHSQAYPARPRRGP